MAARVLAGSVDQNDGLALVLVQLGNARHQFVLRDINSTHDVAGGKILGRANINHHTFVAIDQAGQFARADAAPATAHLVGDQQRQQDDKRAYKQVVGSRKCNQVLNHQKVPGS